MEIDLTYVFLRCIHAEASFSGSFEKIQELKKANQRVEEMGGASGRTRRAGEGLSHPSK